MYKLFKWVWCRDGYESHLFDSEADCIETKRIYGGTYFPVYRKQEDAKT